ncbi:MAG TPA: energy transducer TonB [Bdellovibrionota bacterium]|nr:energy transducer TonB [Bdellovibrionota bacterium]
MRRRWGWLAFALVSIAIHTALWYGYREYRASRVVEPRSVPIFTSMVLSPQQLDAMIRAQKNVVDSVAPEVDVTVHSADYLGDKTRRVDKESVARTDGIGGGPLRRGVRRELKLKPDFQPRWAPEPELNADISGRLQYGNGGGLRGSDDLLKSDIVQGAETLLNTDEYRFASFFNRIKEGIVPRWKPRVRTITRSQTRAKLPEGVYLTEVTVGTDANGNISEVEVTKSSGFAPFDEAASDAFWNLAKLHNLPQEFLNRQERFRTSFAFSVQITNQGLWFDTATENDEKRWARDGR